MDPVRASRIAERKNNGVTVANEPLIVDLLAPTQGVHWVCSQITAIGTFTARSLVANPSPAFGVYLVPVNTQQESIADAITGWNTSARGISLPYDLYTQLIGAGPGVAFVCIVKLVQECIVPAGWMLRFIANNQPGTATPGPGALSSATLTAHVCEERDVLPAPVRNV